MKAAESRAASCCSVSLEQMWDAKRKTWTNFWPWDQCELPGSSQLCCMSFISGKLYLVYKNSEILKVRCTYANDGSTRDVRMVSRFISGVAWADEKVMDCHVLAL